MSDKHTATKTKGNTKKDDQVLEMTPEILGELAAEILASPIDDAHKAMYVYTILKGTFNLDLYDSYQKLLDEYRAGLLNEAKKLEEEYQRVKEEYDTRVAELGEAAVEALDEVAAYGQHIEDKAVEEIERRAGAHESEKVESIRKKLKKSQ